MSEMFVMRRANGDLFTEEKGSKLRIPVWSSEDELARYKERNPELMTYLPIRLSRSVIKRLETGAGREEFFLLTADDPAADLDVGRPISMDEIFPVSDEAQQLAESRL